MNRLHETAADVAPDHQAGGVEHEDAASESNDRDLAQSRSSSVLDDELAGGGAPVEGGAARGVADQALAGPATELPHRAAMEQRFGTSLDHISAHTGPQAQEASRGLGADGFTVGSRIGFRDEHPSEEVVAHEVTHALQQTRGRGAGNEADDEAEAHAAERTPAPPSGATMPAQATQASPELRLRKSAKPAKGAGAKYTDADIDLRVKLALRAAGATAERGVAAAAAARGDDAKSKAAREVLPELHAHVEVAFHNAVKPFSKRYGAEAAAALQSIDKLHGAAELTPKEDARLTKISDDLAVWGEGARPGKQNRGFGGEDRTQAAMLALRTVRTYCDDALAAGTDQPDRLAIGAGLAAEDLIYAVALIRPMGNKAEALKDDIDIATRSLGRMVAWVKHVRQQAQSGQPTRQVPVDSGWVSLVTGQVQTLRGAAKLSDAWIGDVVGDQVYAPDDKVDKKGAQKALNDWNSAQNQTIEDTRRWTTNNWIDYLGKTSSNPRLTWDMGLLDQTMSNAAGNLLTALGENAIKKGSAALAGAMFGSMAGPAGTVIGFVVGLLIETAASVIYDYIFGDKGAKEDKAAADASKRTGEQIGKKHEEFSAAADKARAEQKGALDAAQNNLDEAKTQEKVNSITTDLNADTAKSKEPKNHGDRSLYKQMLKDWVLEHAADEEDANKDTSEAQWETAVKETTGKDELTGRKDLFKYQCRGEWSKTGLATDDTAGHVAHMMRSGDDKSFQNAKFTWANTTDEQAFLRYLERNMGEMGPTYEGESAIRAYPAAVQTECKLDLDSSDGTTYVRRWIYTVEYFTGLKGFDLKSNYGTKGRWSKTSFVVTPD